MEQQRIQFLFLVRRELTACSLICLWFIIANPVTVLPGWGWNLGGLSMISRVPKNYYYDNEKSGIIWDKYSPLALDGQRLVVNGPLESSSDTIEYRTENDESNKIVGYNITAWGPKYFKVFQKDGNVLEYGDPSSLASYFPINHLH